MSKLFTMVEEKPGYLKIRKDTQELKIVVELATEFKNLKVATTIDFFDHIIETLSWGSCLSIGCVVETGKWRSTHTIAEDVGITIGTGLKRLVAKRARDEGINITVRAFAGWTRPWPGHGQHGRRRNCYFSARGPHRRRELVEDMKIQTCSLSWGALPGFPGTVHGLLKG
jgi:hypothetical protein